MLHILVSRDSEEDTFSLDSIVGPGLSEIIDNVGLLTIVLKVTLDFNLNEKIALEILLFSHFIFQSLFRKWPRIKDLDIFKETLSIGSKGEGIIFYDGDTIKQITIENGLSSNFVNKLYCENDNVLWACTNKGLNRLSFNSNGSYSIDVYNYENGLINNEVNDIVVLNDTAWVGTASGLCYFYIPSFKLSNDTIIII